MEHRPPILRSEKPRTDAEVFEHYALDIKTDDTLRCEHTDGHGRCPEGATWRGTMPCGDGANVCNGHRALTEVWLAHPEFSFSCLKCGADIVSLEWRAI